jgi:large subunit ribosomal protein L13
VKTYAPKAHDIERNWYVIDADGAVLGRVASEAAKILRGKHKPIFAPHADTGDHVIIVNASGVRLSGNKLEGKLYHRHSGYPGGLRTMNYQRLLSERPTLVIERAVKGMLPKNRLGRQMFGKLSVYAGAEHPHQAQQPVPLGLGEVPPWNGLPVPPEPAAPAEAAERPARTAKARRAPAASKEESGTKKPARASKPKAETTGTGTRRAPAAGRAKKETASGSSGRSTRSRTSGEAKPAARSRAKPKKDEKES